VVGLGRAYGRFIVGICGDLGASGRFVVEICGASGLFVVGIRRDVRASGRFVVGLLLPGRFAVVLFLPGRFAVGSLLPWRFNGDITIAKVKRGRSGDAVSSFCVPRYAGVGRGLSGDGVERAAANLVSASRNALPLPYFSTASQWLGSEVVPWSLPWSARFPMSDLTPRERLRSALCSGFVLACWWIPEEALRR
jgi:hypothetical protein